MLARRARLALAHALTWVALGLAAVSIATDALHDDGASVALAFGGALAAAGVGAGLLVPHRARTPSLAVAASSLAALAVAAAAVLMLLERTVGLAPVAAIGLAAGLQLAAMASAAALDPMLAPRVRAAPTLLAAAVGAALAAALLPVLSPAGLLLAAAALQLVALLLLVTGGRDAAPAAGDAAPSGTLPTHHAESVVAGRGAPTLLGLLALAAAGAVAIAALRPSLSALGADDPQPAGPAAIALALGGLVGPPLARFAERLLPWPRAAAALATLAGVAALAAPVARSGALDHAVAAVLGVALAASVAITEVARRARLRLPRATPAVLALAGAAGAALAGLLLPAVPLPDAVLAASIACLVAALGMWAPGLRPTAVVGAPAGVADRGRTGR